MGKVRVFYISCYVNIHAVCSAYICTNNVLWIGIGRCVADIIQVSEWISSMVEIFVFHFDLHIQLCTDEMPFALGDTDISKITHG